MLDRFSERARKTVALAREAAMGLQHEYIGTEHILLGLLNEGTGNALNALVVMEVDPASIRAELNRVLRPGPYAGLAEDLMFTPRANKALDLAGDEAQRLGHERVGTEHLLLGLIREDKGLAARALHNADVTLGAARASVVEVVGGIDLKPKPPPVRVGPPPPGVVPMAPTGPAAIRVPEPMRADPLGFDLPRAEPFRVDTARAEAPRLEPRRIDLQREAVKEPVPNARLLVLGDATAGAREEPVGTVRFCQDAAGSPGPGWLPCDGRRIDADQYEALAALLRTQGDGDLDDVRLPDFRGLRVLQGAPLPDDPSCASTRFGAGPGTPVRCWIRAR